MRRRFLLMALCACGPAPAEPSDPGEQFPGGATTNTLLFGANAFLPPAANITDEHRALFFTGNSFFNQGWVTAPASTESRDGLGPTFNSRSCSGCHFKDGRGRPPLAPGEPAEALLFRLSLPGEAPVTGAPLADPVYGGQIQNAAIPGVPAEATPEITYEEAGGAFADGEPFTLRRPRYSFSGPAFGPLDPALRVSPRVAPAMIGLGLLAAVPESRLEALADPDDRDGDGVSGRIQRAWDVAAGRPAVGRFGWKAEQPSVLQQSAGAFLGDLGITSRLFPVENCPPAQAACRAAPSGGAPEIADHLLDRVDLYARLLAVPARHGWDEPEVLRGKALFHQIGCAACHTPQHRTGDADLPELRGQRIWPYTDLLLHDMGPELADDRPVFQASGSEWRTPPLWGLGRYPVVNGHELLLHDGRARGPAEAILWHGGEAGPARDAFRALPRADREALLRFVRSL